VGEHRLVVYLVGRPTTEVNNYCARRYPRNLWSSTEVVKVVVVCNKLIMVRCGPRIVPPQQYLLAVLSTQGDTLGYHLFAGDDSPLL
jgi:hypothetical protein